MSTEPDAGGETASTEDRLPVATYLDRLLERFASLTDGAVADYIPALAAADPDRLAVCVATTDGHVYAAGDAGSTFTIQSISKPFTYALALADRGLPAVLEHIGVEPSGDAFNQISLDRHGRPLNPMINAGAITAASLVAGDDPLQRLLDWYAAFAGRPLEVDDEVYRGERDTGHRNRAISHMLRAVGTLTGDPERALDLYFRQCSVTVTTRDLAVMAATLAAHGRNPVSGQRAMPAALVDHVLSVMTTCGMYDAAGEWLVDVGIPAKSGVGGGIIGVLPGQLGIAVFSPRLDAVGNSARGVAVFRQLSAELGLHFLNVPESRRGTVTRSYQLAEVPSTRRRSPLERAALDAADHTCIVLELSGDLIFSSAEAVSRAALAWRGRTVILDLHRVGLVDPAAIRVLTALATEVERAGGALVVTSGDVAAVLGAEHFADLDSAKTWCEQRILRDAGVSAPGALTLAEHPLALDLSPDLLTELEALGRAKDVPVGAVIVRAGDPASTVYAVLSGEVEVRRDLGDGRYRRLAVLGPGSLFGESALTGQARRTADVVAVAPTRYLELDAADLSAADPALRLAVTQRLLGIAHEALDRSTQQITALAR